MALKTNCIIEDSASLAREAERISKKKAAMLFESDKLKEKESGTFLMLAFIPQFFFEDIYDFAGKI